MEEAGGNTKEGEETFHSYAIDTVSESTSKLPLSTQTVQQRKANTVIDKSTFQEANVSSTIKKQENNFYNYYMYQCDKTNTKSTEKSDGIEVGSFSPAAPQAEHHSNQFHSSLRKPSHEFDNENYTKLSENVYFYNLQPLRKRSRVYLGKQKHASKKWREVAVKLVPHTERNLREIEFLLNLGGHSNIVKIIESQEIFGHIREIYIAMELCSQNLREYISSVKDRSVNFDIHVSYAKQLVNGLTYIHSNNIIHGDLKPDNILFSQNMKYIKISDFGLSEEALDEYDPESRRSSLPGTEGFRAPEIYLDPPKLIFASDIFSMAIVIFYLITLGCHPFGDMPHDWGFNIRYSRNRDLTRLYQLPIRPLAQLCLNGLIESSLRENVSRRPTANMMLQHKFFEGIPCEIHALDTDEMPVVTPPPPLQNISGTAGQPGDVVPDHPSNGQASFGKFSRSRQYTSFTSTVSSQSSLHNRSHLSSEASIHQRLDELEFQFDSLKRLLDSKSTDNPNNSAVFNSYPRSSNLQYQSDFSPDEVPSPEDGARCSTTSRIPSPKQTQLTSDSMQLSDHQKKSLRRRASMKMKSTLKSNTAKTAFKRSDSFSYDRFQRSTLPSTNQDKAQEFEISSPALPDISPKKQSKISKWRNFFKKKEK